MLRDRQLALCAQHGAEPLFPTHDQVCGWSPTASAGAVPLHGLRHPPSGGTCGWYLWGGEHLSEAADFFQPLHVAHLATRCPEVLQFLALPPGWRFLLAPDQLEVWFDPSLLEV